MSSLKTIRESEIYLSKRLGRALSLAAKSVSDEAGHTTAEALAEKYILNAVEREFPGILKVVDDCESAYEVTRRHNKVLFDEWAAEQIATTARNSKTNTVI